MKENLKILGAVAAVTAVTTVAALGIDALQKPTLQEARAAVEQGVVDAKQFENADVHTRRYIYVNIKREKDLEHQRALHFFDNQL